MDFVKIGGEKLSRIAFGAWAIGGAYKYGWGKTDDAESIASICHAIDRGVNWIDTAAVYGWGHSERVIGEALKKKKTKVFIATKCGLIRQTDDSLSRILKPESIFKEIDESLERLGVSEIDLYQCHWPDSDTPIEETWEAMGELVKKGKVRHIGVCNFNIDLLEKARKIYPVFSLQNPYSLVQREIEKDLMPYCHKHKIPVLAYSPMQSGLLTGTFSSKNLALDDWRAGSKGKVWFHSPNVDIYQSLIEQMKFIADSKKCTVGQLAVGWTLREGAAHSAMVGARNLKQVEENVHAHEVKFSEENLREIDILLKKATLEIQRISLAS